MRICDPFKEGGFFSVPSECQRPESSDFLETPQIPDFYGYLLIFKGFPGGSEDKASACNAGDLGFNPWVGKIPWRRKWQPTPVFLPGESHGQRSLAGYSPWGRRVGHD